jgi:hypothetical protein
MIALIIVAVVLYIMIGLFVAGFLDIDVGTDGMAFFLAVTMWSLFIVAAGLIVISAPPIRLGKKLGAKYLKSIGGFFDKLLNN